MKTHIHNVSPLVKILNSSKLVANIVSKINIHMNTIKKIQRTHRFIPFTTYHPLQLRVFKKSSMFEAQKEYVGDGLKIFLWLEILVFCVSFEEKKHSSCYSQPFKSYKHLSNLKNRPEIYLLAVGKWHVCARVMAYKQLQFMNVSFQHVC